MQSLQVSSSVKNTPIRLSPEELENPVLVLNHFCTYYDLNDVRMKLEEWLFMAFGADAPELGNHMERSSLLFFSQQIQTLIEANYVLFKSVESAVKEANKARVEKKKTNRSASKRKVRRSN
jgi:hypothetical protein